MKPNAGMGAGTGSRHLLKKKKSNATTASGAGIPVLWGPSALRTDLARAYALSSGTGRRALLKKKKKSNATTTTTMGGH